jgi:hypothetical protein
MRSRLGYSHGHEIRDLVRSRTSQDRNESYAGNRIRGEESRGSLDWKDERRLYHPLDRKSHIQNEKAFTSKSAAKMLLQQVGQSWLSKNMRGFDS